MAQCADLAVRPTHPLDAPLDIDLVEAECDRERAREIGADVLPEFAHRRQIRQCRRVAEEVVEGDEGMGLATAVGELQFRTALSLCPASRAATSFTSSRNACVG